MGNLLRLLRCCSYTHAGGAVARTALRGLPELGGERVPGDAPPPVRLNDLDFDLLARLGGGPAPVPWVVPLAARDPVIAARTPVIEMLAVENARLTLPSWLPGGRAVISHNILPWMRSIP
jgi:hypothetical protein